jgi:hypothetical protein
MIAPAEQAQSHWSKPAGSVVSASKIAFLKDTVCHLEAAMMVCQPPIPSAPVMGALKQLIDIVMQLRSPLGGWPAGLAPTPANLAPYVSEETWALLDALDQDQLSAPVGVPPQGALITPMAALIPHVLWLLASSNYEVMRLLEGVRSRIYGSDGQFSLGVVRLVPVLSLTVGGNPYCLDLVTQAEPDSALFLEDDLRLQLVENDLDDRPMVVSQMLACLGWGMGQTKPQLSQLLDPGWLTQTLSPFQPWDGGSLRLQLYLAPMADRQRSAASAALTSAPANIAGLASTPDNGPSAPGSASEFTLDDFAEVLEDDPQTTAPGILGDWLTFTDETWVQEFLNSCVQEILLQHLPRLAAMSGITPEARELTCLDLVHGATILVQGSSTLSKHTFVHEPTLVADVWLRLRWYLAHCSERIMQLMGGLSTRVLIPGRGWQRGYLYLRPVMTLILQENASTPGTGPRIWMLDLGSGRLVPTQPLTLSEDAVVAIVDDRAWRSPITVGELKSWVEQDFVDYAPAIATLGQTGTQVNLHRLESDEGRQPGHLILNWGFTLQAAL